VAAHSYSQVVTLLFFCPYLTLLSLYTFHLIKGMVIAIDMASCIKGERHRKTRLHIYYKKIVE
jgi:hypothetical protein